LESVLQQNLFQFRLTKRIKLKYYRLYSGICLNIERTGKNLSVYFKPVLVLIISILIFAGIAFLADEELTDFIQVRFYNPSTINFFVKENAKDAELIQNHILDLQKKFALTLREPAIRRSFNYNQSPVDILERSRRYGILLETTGGLQYVQFVDSNGTRIYYSTSSRDIVSQDADLTVYRNYADNPLALPYYMVSVPSGGSAKYTMDEQGGRIVFSYTFMDSMSVYRGTAIFSVSVRALAEKFIANGRLKASDDISVISSPPGILFGSPESYGKDIFSKVSMSWNSGKQGRVILDSAASGAKFSLISFKADNGLFFGRLVDDALFSISNSMKLILYLSLFLTFYLTLLFLLNYKPNSVTAAQNRMTNLKEKLFEQLYVNKSSQDRVKWILELEQRREAIRNELKNNLKIPRSSEKTIDGIIDKSWDEMLTDMKAGSLKTQPEKTSYMKEVEETEEIEELESIEEPAEEPPAAPRGILELASEIEFSSEYPEGIEEPQEDDKRIDIELDIDIVSPFASMFDSLKDKPEEKTKKPAKKRSAGKKNN